MKKPLWQLTGEELSEIISQVVEQKLLFRDEQVMPQKTSVYGIRGIAQLFNCSTATANLIKRSGIIDGAISQINRKIVVDAELALELIKKGRRKS